MRQKKFLWTKRLKLYGYNAFSNLTPIKKDSDISSAPKNYNSMDVVLDVTKLPQKTFLRKWEEFYTNGRSEFHTGCIVLCSVLINGSPFHFWKENRRNTDEHAEVKALQKIVYQEENVQTEARIITVYASYSPCDKCADSIITFLQMRPTCKMLLYFTSIYRHNREREHRDGLRKLCAYPSIVEIRVFTGKEWQELATKCGVLFVHNDSFRDYFDNYWKKEFDHILMTKEVDGESWKSLQLAPRIQYLKDGGDPSFIQYESHINTHKHSSPESTRKKKYPIIIFTICILIIFTTVILTSWISIQESAEESQNFTRNIQETG